MKLKAPLPASTLEINEAAAYFYAIPQAAETCALYITTVRLWADGGMPITVATVKTSIGGDLVHITYPQTGEQLARAAYERLLAQGIPKMALRFHGEVEREEDHA